MKIFKPKLLLFSISAFILSMAGIFIYEFVYQDKIVFSATIFFSILSFLFTSQLPNGTLHALRKILRTGFLLLIVFAVIQFILSSFDFYNVYSPPAFFYTLKLYRLLTLSGTLIVHIVVLIAGLLLIASDKQKKIKLRFSIPLLMLTFLSTVLLYQTEQILGTYYKDSGQVFQNMNTSFEDRITYRFGGSSYFGWIWPYTQFIKRHTSENAVIIIPPQENPWKMEGNVGFLRWFLYPRRLTKIDLSSAVVDQANYVLIALGECDEGDCGWPKIDIPAEQIEYIILIDRVTQEETIITDHSYELNKVEFRWGIIKLK